MARLRQITPVVIATVCASCGGDTIVGPEPAAFEELCGHEGPVRILPLEVDPNFHSVGFETVGDRYVLSMRSSVPDEEYGTTADIWSVGHCGEDPILLIDDRDTRGVRVHPNYDDVVFICDEATGWYTAHDIYGVRPPNPVIETRECSSKWTDFGVLTILGEGETGPLVLQPWPADPLAEAAEQLVLVDEVRRGTEPTHISEDDVFRVNETEAFAITTNDELVVVDLDSLAVTMLAEGVREFDSGALGRWLIWQGVEVTNDDDPEWPQGPIFVLDRESGQITEIDQTALGFTLPDTMLLEPLGLIYYRAGYWNDESAARWIRLPSLESYAVGTIGSGMMPVRVIDDTRALLGHYFESPYVVLDTATGELTTIYDGPSDGAWITDEGLLLLTEDNGELVRINYSGETQTLARHATVRYWPANWVVPGDDRIVTAFAVNDDHVGQLVIVDPATLDERTIDDDVHAFSSLGIEQEGELIVGYTVTDPERYGVWIAKLAK